MAKKNKKPNNNNNNKKQQQKNQQTSKLIWLFECLEFLIIVKGNN